MRFPDNPVPVSIDFLRRIDADPPGTWLAQPKYDGWRRIAIATPDGWDWNAKPAGANTTRTLPESLINAFVDSFRASDFDPGQGLDMEWIGPHRAGAATDQLHVFDFICFERPCAVRFNHLRHHFRKAIQRNAAYFGSNSTAIHRVEIRENPGLVDFFQQQLTVPHSEGLVLRRADSKLVGAHGKCADNPLTLKVKFAPVKERA